LRTDKQAHELAVLHNTTVRRM